MRGAIAKENVIKKIKSAFGAEYIGEESKKFYVWADDGGERVQIAISLTCPKTNIAPQEEAGAFPSLEDPKERMITPEEQKNIEMLMEKLGI